MRISRTTILVFLIALCYAMLNTLHVIIQWFIHPKDRIFVGISHYFEDFFLYVAAMAQGTNGAWIYFSHPFTNESMSPTWYYWPYVTLGHLGGFLGLPPYVNYNLTVFFLTILVVVLWFILAGRLFPDSKKYQWICFILIITQTSFYDIAEFVRNGTVQTFGEFWFSPAPLFNRFGSVPMHIMSTGLYLAIFLLVDRPLLLPLISFIASLLNPIQTLLLVFSVSTSLLLLRKKNAQIILTLVIPAIVGAVLTSYEFAHQPVFVAARVWELAQQIKVSPLDFLLSVGFPILFVIPGLVSIVTRPTLDRLALVVYGLISVALFFSPLPKFVQLSAVRFLHPVPFAIFAIAATEGVRIIAKRTPHLILIAAIYLLLTVPPLIAQIDRHTKPASNPLLLMDTIYNHVPKSVIDALTWLRRQRNLSDAEIVLADPAAPFEVLVPVLSLKPSFSGHPLHTLYPDVKEQLRQRFFRGQMNETQAQEFVKNHRIGFVVASPTTQLTYPFLKRIYTNDDLYLYTIVL